MEKRAKSSVMMGVYILRVARENTTRRSLPIRKISSQLVI
jgi:hypothetical protein